MSGNMNQDYHPSYKENESLQNYHSNTIEEEAGSATYEVYTLDESGNEMIDGMSKEEALQTVKEISVHYGDHAIVEFSDDGMTALIENEKEDRFEGELFEEQVVIHEGQDTAFSEDRKHYESIEDLPAFSGIYETDKIVAAAVEESSKEEKAFVYDIIRRNFLIKDSSSFTEEERQANISLGMKKAEYAAKHFLAEEHKKTFLEAMELIAKLASAGTSDSSGKMDYGVKKGSYLGYGSNLIDTANPVDMMRRMDTDAYKQYQEVCKESRSEDKLFQALKYLSDWYFHTVLKNPSMLSRYKKESEEYVEQKVKNQKLDTTFAAIGIDNKTVFLESLKTSWNNRPNFLASILEREVSLEFWKIAL